MVSRVVSVPCWLTEIVYVFKVDCAVMVVLRVFLSLLAVTDILMAVSFEKLYYLYVYNNIYPIFLYKLFEILSP